MGKPLIVHCNIPAFKEWPTNFKLLFQALPPYRSTSSIGYASKKLSEMVSNSARSTQ